MGKERTTGFDRGGGHPAVDLVNTVAWRLSEAPIEKLTTVQDLVRWCREAGYLDDRAAAAAAREAVRSPKEAARLLREALEVRETGYRLLAASIDGTRPKRADLEQFNRFVQRAARQTALRWTADGYRWESSAPSPLRAALEAIVRGFAELLASEDARRVSRCEDDRGCGWLFIDRSRSRARRWCSMADCGNRAKARRHYRRRRSEA